MTAQGYRDYVSSTRFGLVPSHWQEKALKYVLSFSTGWTPPTDDDSSYEGENLWANISDLGPRVIFDTAKRISDSAVAAANVSKSETGSLLFSFKLTLGEVSFVGADMYTNEAIATFPPSPAMALAFCYYALPHFLPLNAAENIYGAKLLNQRLIQAAPLLIPSLVEQKDIAAYLDRETARIDTLMTETQRLMRLLQDRIDSMVLSSFAEAGARAVRLGDAATVVARPVDQQPGVPYTRLGLYNRGRGAFHKDASEMDSMGESDFFWIEPGDLILSGQFAWEGAVALAGQRDGGCVVSHRYPVLRGKGSVALTEYLFALLCTRHGDFLLNEHSRGAAGRNRPLNIQSLLKEKISIPSMQTQRTIAAMVHQRFSVLEDAATSLRLLTERRHALVAAAVTGKIDVRGTLKGAD